MATKPRSSRGRVAPSSGPTRTAASEEPEQQASTPEATAGPEQPTGPRTTTVHLPFVTAQLRTPQVRLPGREELGAAVQGVRSKLPSPSALLFYSGLAVTAALGVIEWPVAAAIGVGSALASRGEATPPPQGGGDGAASARR